jgi:hypothetical protein
MSSLYLEDHAFRIAENQKRLFDYLESVASNWNWNADLEAETLTFTDAQSGAPLLTCPAFLIGSESSVNDTWLWAWANEHISLPERVKRLFAQLRQEAADQNLPALTASEPFGLADPTQGLALSILCAGYFGCFCFYAGGYDGGRAFLAVEGCRQAECLTIDVLGKITVINMTIQAVSFNHRTAILAYLGEPKAVDRQTLIFDINGADLNIRFDEENRIAQMTSTIAQEHRANRAEVEASQPGPAKRLFGRR